MSEFAFKLFQGSTTLHAKKLLRARTLQSELTIVHGWPPRLVLLLLTAKKVIDVKIDKVKHYFICHTKIRFKLSKFKTFKAN